MKYILSLIMLAAFSLSSTAQDAVALRKKHFNLQNGLAIEGYDPVAYFTYTLKDWNKNEATFKKNADINWQMLFK